MRQVRCETLVSAMFPSQVCVSLCCWHHQSVVHRERILTNCTPLPLGMRSFVLTFHFFHLYPVVHCDVIAHASDIGTAIKSVRGLIGKQGTKPFARKSLAQRLQLLHRGSKPRVVLHACHNPHQHQHQQQPNYQVFFQLPHMKPRAREGANSVCVATNQYCKEG
jgi:hypothetical protein